MYITKEKLIAEGACRQGLKWFERYFPDGAELIDVINHKYIDKHTLHWGMAHLETSEEEKKAYNEKLNIDCDKRNNTIYQSDNISHSTYVTYSTNVIQSEYVFHSEDVEYSDNIAQSKNVERSGQIFGSEFVYDSRKVLQSNNINHSHNIVSSNYVLNSHDVYNAISIKRSGYITDAVMGNTKRITDSYFISSCQDIEKCLFCQGINNKKYHVFNKEVDVDEYEILINQMHSILKDWHLGLVQDEWPKFTIPLDQPRMQRNIAKQFDLLPEKFWRWVRTLPGYDPKILYMITFGKELI